MFDQINIGGIDYVVVPDVVKVGNQNYQIERFINSIRENKLLLEPVNVYMLNPVMDEDCPDEDCSVSRLEYELLNNLVKDNDYRPFINIDEKGIPVGLRVELTDTYHRRIDGLLVGDAEGILIKKD